MALRFLTLIADASRVYGTFVLLEKPVDFGAADRQPVDIVKPLFTLKTRVLNI